MLTWVLIITPFVLLYLYFKRVNQYWETRKVPYMKPWLFFGNFGPFILRQESIADMVEKMYNSFENERYIGMFSFLVPTLLLKDLNLIKQISIKEFDHFVDHRTFISDEMDPLFAKNLFSLKGDKWRNMRSTLSPAFTGSKMRAMFVLMSECAEQFTNYFTGIIDSCEPLTLEMKDTFTRFANDVIATTAFGIKCDSMKEKENEFYIMGKETTNFSGIRSLKFFGYSVSPSLMKFFRVKVFPESTGKFFRSIIKNNIKSREEQGIVRPDMIHLLMEARKGKLKHEENKNKDEGAGFATVEESDVGKQSQANQEVLTDDDITAQALIFFFAGFDTISTTLCHTVYELALNMDVQEKLQKEIDETLEECNGKITYDAILKMKYLDMVLCESLRKWPPGPAVDRVCYDSFTIPAERPGEVPVILNKEDAIWIPIYGIHRDPKYYPNPEKFDPERFSDENKGNIVPFTYLPFGVGPRNCIGSRFALLESKTLLLHMLNKFSFVIVEKSEIPIKISRTQFNMNAENGFWLGLKSRSII